MDRNAVKRVLRESARMAAPALDAVVGSQALDIVLRLKAPVPARTVLPAAVFKRQLRAEADDLLAQLASRLTGGSRQ